jgi:ankyrin repeat protein
MTLRESFISAATWHGSLEEANAILAAHPEIAGSDIHAAAILGDQMTVRRLLALDTDNARAVSGPYGGDALVYLCLSKYLRLDDTRSAQFVQTAEALLEAGANPNSGFWTQGPHPEFETALYGAAGVAHNAALTRLLLEHGADPNDNEAAYHSPESYDNAAMSLLVETGKMTEENRVMMLIRKLDWHDVAGVRYLLRHVGSKASWKRGLTPLHHALARDNSLEIITLLVDHGADPSHTKDGLTAVARAAREGRGDVLQFFAQRGIPLELQGVDRLIAACATDDVAVLASATPKLVDAIKAMGGELLSKFSEVGNLPGVKHLLDLGVDVKAPFIEGDGYFGVPRGSLAIHVSAWHGHPSVVKLLIERGSPVDVPDGNGHSSLALAIRACVDSYWVWRRSPESVEALLNAGASVKGAPYPSGYAEVDALLKQHGA